MKRSPNRSEQDHRWFLYAPVAIASLLADQISKHLVLDTMAVGSTHVVIPHFFQIDSARNRGIVFGWLSGATMNVPQGFFIGVTLIALGFVLAYSRSKRREKGWNFYALSLIFGGAVGNLADRIQFGRVVDFLDFSLMGHHWYVFNLADFCIVLGVGFLFLSQFWRQKTVLRPKSSLESSS